MEWRVTIERCGASGKKQTDEVTRGGCADPRSTLDPLDLTLDDDKALLAGVQRRLVQAGADHLSMSRRRRSFRMPT